MTETFWYYPILWALWGPWCMRIIKPTNTLTVSLRIIIGGPVIWLFIILLVPVKEKEKD
jgi:hypothetical protein